MFIEALLYSVFMLCMFMCVLQDYDMIQLCWSPEIFSKDIAPPALHAVCYRQHPEENEDIGHFIYEVCVECMRVTMISANSTYLLALELWKRKDLGTHPQQNDHHHELNACVIYWILFL